MNVGIDWAVGGAFAHRGLHGPGVPENSLAAFRAAADTGVGVELDVHAVAGEEVAVFHDATLMRMCGVPGLVADEDRAGLRRLRLDGSDEHVPTLEEALGVIDGRVPLLVELKAGLGPAAGPYQPEELAHRVWERLRWYHGQWAVLAFDPAGLAWFRRRVPDAARIQLAASRRVPGVAVEAAKAGVPVVKQLLLEWLIVAAISRPHMIGYDVRALPHLAVSLARRLGCPVLAGVTTTVEEAAAARAHADAVVFEDAVPAGIWRT